MAKDIAERSADGLTKGKTLTVDESRDPLVCVSFTSYPRTLQALTVNWTS